MVSSHSMNASNFFVDRSEILSTLKNRCDNLNKGIINHTAISGPKKIGKTQLAFKLIQSLQNAIHVDCEYILGTPKDFAYRVLGIFLTRYLGREFNFFDKEETKKMALESDNKQIYELIISLDSGDDETIISSLFSFFTKLEDKYVVILDEFQKLLKLNRYRSISDVMTIFRSNLESQTNVLYIIMGSEVNKFEKLLKNKDSALFEMFTYEKISALTKTDAKTLCTKILATKNMTIENNAIEFLTSFLGQMPYYITVISQRLLDIAGDNDHINSKTVLECLYQELVTDVGNLNSYFEYLFDIILYQVKESTKIKDALLFISKKKTIRASDLAKDLLILVSEATNILNRLIEIDVVSEDGGSYQISTPLFAFWIDKYYIDIKSSYASDASLESAKKVLETEYHDFVSENLRLQKDILELMRSLERKHLDATIFNAKEDVIIPRFEKIKSSAFYSEKYGFVSTACAALGIENWLVEIAESNQIDQIKKVIEKKDAIERKEDIVVNKIWIIVDQISDELIEYAKKNNFLISSFEDFQKLQNMV